MSILSQFEKTKYGEWEKKKKKKEFQPSQPTKCKNHFSELKNTYSGG